MNRTIRTTVAALAVAGFVAQPISANAGEWICPPKVSPVTADPGPLPMLATVGFFLCAGFALGKQDVDAAKEHRQVTGKERLHAFVGCLLPFHKHKHAVSVKG
jgi:hypothetical protein